MAIDRIPGVGPTNADIATAVAAPSAATIAAAVAAPSAATIAAAVAAPSAATIAAAVAAPSSATIASAVAAAVPTTAGITSIVQANAGGPFTATWANVASFSGNSGGTVSLSSLGGYKYLRIYFANGGTGGNTRYRIRFNGDTSTNYSWSAAGVNSRDSSFSTTGITLNSANTGGYDGFMFDIIGANSTTQDKMFNGFGSSGTAFIETFRGIWKSTAAITSMDIGNTAGTNMNDVYVRIIGAN